MANKREEILSVHSISRIDALVIACAMFIIRPYYYGFFPLMDNLFTAACFILFLTMIIIYAKKSIRIRSEVVSIKKAEFPFLWFLVWAVIYLAVTLINTPAEFISLFVSVVIMSFAYITVSSIKFCVNKARVLRAVRFIFVALLLVDCLTIILGISEKLNIGNLNWSFLGSDNYAGFSVIILLAIIYEISYYLYGRLQRVDILLYFLILAMKLYTISIAALLSIIVFGILFLWKRKFTARLKKLTFLAIVMLSVCLVLGIALFKIHYFLNSIFQILGLNKGTEFSYRGVIWPAVLSAIVRNPVLGYGKMGVYDLQFQMTVGLPLYATEANHCHNLLLEILYSTGLVGLVVFFKMLKSVTNRYVKLHTLNVLYLAYIVYFVTGLFDGYILTNAFFILLAFMANYEEIFRT